VLKELGGLKQRDDAYRGDLATTQSLEGIRTRLACANTLTHPPPSEGGECVERKSPNKEVEPVADQPSAPLLGISNDSNADDVDGNSHAHQSQRNGEGEQQPSSESSACAHTVMRSISTAGLLNLIQSIGLIIGLDGVA
jgi:hypothetical protein